MVSDFPVALALSASPEVQAGGRGGTEKVHAMKDHTMGGHELYQQEDLLQGLGFGRMTFERVEGSKGLTVGEMLSENGGSVMIWHLNAS